MLVGKDGNFASAQLGSLKSLYELVKDHPIMGQNLSIRIDMLKEELSRIPTSEFDTSIRFRFNGDAVWGSMGIKSRIVSDLLKPLNDILKSSFSLIRFGQISKRGQPKGNKTFDLYLTSLPQGSFGFELSLLDSTDLFMTEDVSNTFQETITTLNNVFESDETFSLLVDNKPKRIITHLKTFVESLANDRSGLIIDSGRTFVELTPEKVYEGFSRLSRVNIQEEELKIEGVLRGILLDSSRFEMYDSERKLISGMVSPELDEDLLVRYEKSYLNQLCIITLLRVDKTIAEAQRKTTYELLRIEDSYPSHG